MTDRKKDFRKAIATIRSDFHGKKRFQRDYPKAIMTASQERANMATVNCPSSRLFLDAVSEHPAFAEFLSKHPADVAIEATKRPGYKSWYDFRLRLFFKARNDISKKTV